ncbi:tyrosine-type recombinase/integrase, partial [Geminocystis sp. GBBB08]|uniref:tyrosine-type recombinase/integrase n=1 Tax=Geminocystis sp. GBBB08 TaxID=2604140 RepID=UPI0027E33216
LKNHENITEKILMTEEIKSLIAHAKNNRDGLLIKLLANTGLRISEAINLKWSDIKLNKICVFGKGGKTRYISIKEELLTELLTLKNKFCQYVFYSNRLTPLKRENVHTMLKDVAKKSNLTDKVSCHWLRHSVASHALNNGASLHQVKELLGHDSINSPASYLHTLNGTTATDFIDF